VLITDASTRAIKSGQTDAKLLRKFNKSGVTIYSREGLHAKVALFGNYAIVGSANMSGSDLIEASIISDNPVVVSGIAAFIKKLSSKPSKLSADDIEKLCAIEVIRFGHQESFSESWGSDLDRDRVGIEARANRAETAADCS
jgi:hypothetical protein